MTSDDGQAVDVARFSQKGWEVVGLKGSTPPPLLQRALNLGRAALRHVMDGARPVSDEDRRIRLDVCGGCDRLRPEDSVCLECGCYVNVKAGWRSEDCPLKKWPAPTGESEPAKRSGCGGCGGR